MRRIHLYSGLFMFPWVLLYGFSGWFFNHPQYFTGDQRSFIDPSVVVEGQLSEFPRPEEVAAAVVEEINLASFLVDGPTLETIDDPAAYYSGYLALTANGESQSHTIHLHPVTGAGEVRTTEVAEPQAGEPTPVDPLAGVGAVEVVSTPYAIAVAVAPALLEELGLEPAEAFSRRGNGSLVFDADVDGQRSRITYNLATGAVSARAMDAATRSLAWKPFLQRLHRSRGYVPNASARAWWAVSVDMMFLSMVFWGLSGLFMWWQIKRTRLLGATMLTAGLLSATFLAVGMHGELSAGGRGRGGGGGNRGGRSAASVPAPTNANTLARLSPAAAP